MKKMEIRDIQLTELSILDYLDAECKKMNLRYGLTSGSVLGAIRHKGFIPWDDDIDIVMPRPDYEKLIKNHSNQDERFILKSPYNDDDYLYEYVKIMDSKTVLIEDPDRNAIRTHVYIDVFPVDGVPSDKNERNLHFRKVKIAKILFAARVRLKIKVRKARGIQKIAWAILNSFCCIFSKNFYVRHLDKISKKYPFDSSDYAAVVTGQGEKEVLRTEDYQLNGLVEFEGKMYNTYLKPEDYLKQFFGDYMKLPPIENRKSHNFKAWIID